MFNGKWLILLALVGCIAANAESGTLLLNVQTPENKSFWSCIEYEVK